MPVFRVEKTAHYTVRSNNHLRNPALSLKVKGILSLMLSLPEEWDYTLKGLSLINKESIDAIREAVRELERTFPHWKSLYWKTHHWIIQHWKNLRRKIQRN